jgi:hypothetical protein
MANWKKVVPVRELDSILNIFHNSSSKGGHAGRDAMVAAISMFNIQLI